MTEKQGNGILMAIGGGESGDVTLDSVRIFEKFLELSGGKKKARIVLMTVATDDPEAAEERYRRAFKEADFENLEAVNIAERQESFDVAVLEKIERANGLYFTGGDQLHVTALTGGTPLHEIISAKFEKGMTIAGTSAGAMMMSSVTLVSGLADCAPRLRSVEVVPGMELLPNSIIDTHFSQRGRHGRLLSAVAHNPQVLGFGIDERTAMIVKGESFEVIGEGAVTVFDVGKSKHTNLPYINSEQTIGIFDVCIHILPDGYKYDFERREPVAETYKKLIARANEE